MVLFSKLDVFFEGDKYILKENALPVIVSFGIRTIDRSSGKSPVETFCYYFDDHGVFS